MTKKPIYRDILLIGGGHSHALFLRMWGMNPIAGVRITLISDGEKTPYSGMLPGVMAGHYAEDEHLIDLPKLCGFAGARFINSRVSSIDPNNNRVHLHNRPSIEFDYASINTGAAPDQSIKGVTEYATPIKPIATCLKNWHNVKQALQQKQSDTHIAVVGSGAGGLETLLAMQHALTHDQSNARNTYFHWLIRGNTLLEDYPKRVQNIVKKHLVKLGVQLHYHFDVQEITPKQVIAQSGKTLNADKLFWCTAVSAPQWPKASGLTTDQRGFITVTPQLQCKNHSHIFAAGDIAHMPHAPRPKAGVYAVRQAPILFHNIRALLLNQSLKNYQPQDHFLSLLALGKKTAVGSRPPFVFSGNWVWRWKNRIDKQFMAQFSDFPEMVPTSEQAAPAALLSNADKPEMASIMRCGGCGAKVGANTLGRVLDKLDPIHHANIEQSMGDDAAVFNVPSNHSLVQSVDQLRQLIDDPYLFGRLSALHALSDLFAMNATAHSAQAMVNLPYADARIVERDLKQLMAGAVDELNAHGCALIGGHTAEAAELSLGFVVNGTANADKLLHKGGMQSGDVLILTQALGTGVIFAADMRLQADGAHTNNALQSMLQSNQSAAEIIFEHGATACTDVTGFGLAGHLSEMLKASECCAELELNAIPALSGAHEYIAQGIRSSLYDSNRQAERFIARSIESEKHRNYPLLFDPQTCSGLLASVPAKSAARSLSALHAAGYHDATVIGRVSNTPFTHDSAWIDISTD